MARPRLRSSAPRLAAGMSGSGRPPDRTGRDPDAPGRSRAWLREAALIAAATLALAAAVELLLGYLYFQKHGERASAIYQAAEAIGVRLAESEAADRIEAFESRWGVGRGDIWTAFFSGEHAILAEFQGRYAQTFARLAGLARSIESRMIVVYIPSDIRGRSREQSRAFFGALAARHGIDFVDLTDSMGRHERDHTHFTPTNIHLTRFGNRLVAEGLFEHLNGLGGYRSGHPPRRTGGRFGDLEPSSTTLMRAQSDRPYQVVSNAYGFRMDYDFPVDTPRQKILVLGDSFTFGPYLPNEETYPAVLDRLLDGPVVMNAGIEGYTIVDQLALYEERAMHIAPDITVLQVLDNDLFGFFYFMLEHFARDRRRYEPSDSERRFFAAVAARHRAEERRASAPPR